jgi:NAD(P)-dependent dehydrogenase (short-subunit alcohol dehydrogenase family)
MSGWTPARMPRQDGRTAIVTGANSGLGWVTALELARAGADVVLTVRSPEKGQNAVERIRRELPSAKVRFEVLDLDDLSSIRAFVERMAALPKLDLLVNNAGVMALPYRAQTSDGFERQLATNFLGPFALTAGLYPALRRSPSPRVTTLTSSAARQGLKRVNFGDLQLQGSYTPWNAYCQSKLADLMFAIELGERASNAGVALVSDAAHPGVVRTNLVRSGPQGALRLAFRAVVTLFGTDAARGAMPALRAATDPSARSGSLWAPGGRSGVRGAPAEVPVYQEARDSRARSRLWAEAERLTGAHFDFENS